MNRQGKKDIYIGNQIKLQQSGSNSTVGKNVDRWELSYTEGGSLNW